MNTSITNKKNVANKINHGFSWFQNTTCREEGAADNWNTNNVSGKAEGTLASAVPKLQTKRRIAAQFASR